MQAHAFHVDDQKSARTSFSADKLKMSVYVQTTFVEARALIYSSISRSKCVRYLFSVTQNMPLTTVMKFISEQVNKVWILAKFNLIV